MPNLSFDSLRKFFSFLDKERVWMGLDKNARDHLPLITSTMSVAATVAKRIMPLFDRVLVQRAVAETKTKGGLLIPETAQKSPLEATVVAAGPGARNATTGETIPMSVAVGDRVLMPEWGSNKLELDGQEFHVIRETDIVAKLSD